MNDIKKYTLKQHFSLILRGYKLLGTLPKPVLLSTVLSSVFDAVLPFVNIYFSAEILNELVGVRDIQRLTLLVVLTISLNLAIMLTRNALSRWQAYNNSIVWQMIRKIYYPCARSKTFAFRRTALA